MIDVFLLDNPALVPVLVVLIAVVCVGIGYLVLRVARNHRSVLSVLAALSVVPIVALALVPVSRRMDDVPFCTFEFSMPSLTSVEMVANVALLFPLVFFAALATRRPLPLFAAGTGLSVVIELVQATIRVLGRACDVGDWAMNSVGVAFAALLAAGTLALADRVGGDRYRRRQHDGTHVT